ncbi:dihydrofolate reductase [Boudabousia marimammalium]|uniref:dihydrofolate reductase n=1 Tax=Boudabousia marimammalium TaxID=156892 RepID=A0A1Q5PLZ9_9ACTO|nr:dihydrofolate reductase [Boudabousia marimammalium]OKL48047.1 hypothetical protein BM477_06150 [Boudabousia marimammalium]
MPVFNQNPSRADGRVPSVVGAIWAQSPEGVIAREGKTPWHVPADLQLFVQLTHGFSVIMGRKTWESFPQRPLEGRTNIVLTSQTDWEAEGALVAHSLPEALDLASNFGDETWIIGGESVYLEALDICTKLVISTIDMSFPEVSETPERFTFAPDVDSHTWTRVPQLSDESWRPRSGEARWRVDVYVRS